MEQEQPNTENKPTSDGAWKETLKSWGLFAAQIAAGAIISTVTGHLLGNYLKGRSNETNVIPLRKVS